MNNYLTIVARWCYQWIKPRPFFYKKVVECGVTKNKRATPLIVSLTSFPSRKTIVPYTIETILSQTLKPDRVILWLAIEQFKNKEADLPKHLLRLKKFGLEIKWTNDIRSYKKLIPSLHLCPNAIIVTADDDVYYPPTWLEKLYKASLKHPGCIFCHKCVKLESDENGRLKPYNEWKISRHTDKNVHNIQIGSNGVLYPPKCLYKDVTREDLFINMAPDADDLWFWAMALLAGTSVKVVKEPLDPLDGVFSVIPNSLWDSNQQGNNDKVLKSLIEFYPILKKLIFDAHYEL